MNLIEEPSHAMATNFFQLNICVNWNDNLSYAKSIYFFFPTLTIWRVAVFCYYFNFPYIILQFFCSTDNVSSYSSIFLYTLTSICQLLLPDFSIYVQCVLRLSFIFYPMSSLLSFMSISVCLPDSNILWCMRFFSSLLLLCIFCIIVYLSCIRFLNRQHRTRNYWIYKHQCSLT